MECEKAQRIIFVSWFPKVLPAENGVYIAGTTQLSLYYLLYSIVLGTCTGLNIGQCRAKENVVRPIEAERIRVLNSV